ncbi:MAG: MmcQ/YjbR family DNA-binding protein [Acidimicrobiales bacterium]
MATIDDVAALAHGFPEVTEGTSWGHRTWKVGNTGFAWVRPFSKADVRRFGDAPVPDGPIVALRVDDLGEKEAVLAEGRPGIFDIEHFAGYPAVLVQLSKVRARDLREAMEDAWLCCAPPALAESWLSSRRRRR